MSDINGIRVRIPPIDDVFAKPGKVFLVVVPTGENDDHPSLIAIMDVPGYSHLTGRTMRYIAGQWIRVAEVVFNGWKNKRQLWAAISKAMGNYRWSSITNLQSVYTTEQKFEWEAEDRRVACER